MMVTAEKERSRLLANAALDGGRTGEEVFQREMDIALATKQPEVVVVTGASAGLGRAIVRAFAREGGHIGLLARGRDGLAGAHRDVEDLGGKGLVIPVDVAGALAFPQ